MNDLENQDIVEEDAVAVDADTQIDEEASEEVISEDEISDDDSDIIEEAVDDEDQDNDLLDDLENIAEEETSAANHQITSDDIDVSEDIDAMLNGQELTEEFQEQVKTIFEAAIVAKVNDKIEDIYAGYEEELQENVAEIRQELSEKVDEYLSYVAKEYVTENTLAIETGLKVEIMENFMNGIKNVFEENYIDVPQEKMDLYTEALDTLDSKESELNEQFDKNMDLTNKIGELERELVLINVTEGLTDTQVEKVKTLSEGVDFDNKDDMVNKITMIRDNYFPTDTKVESGILDESALETSVEDSPVVQEENKVQSPRTMMEVYATALNRTKD